MPERRWERYASVGLAWIAGSSPAMTKKPTGKNERKRRKKIGGETPTDARLFCRAYGTAAPLSAEAHIYRRSTAVLAPRSLSSQGTQPRARLPGTWRTVICPLSGITRPCLSHSPARTAHPGRSAEGLDAQSRPGADCIVPRGHRLCSVLRSALAKGALCEQSSDYLSLSVTIVNVTWYLVTLKETNAIELKLNN